MGLAALPATSLPPTQPLLIPSCLTRPPWTPHRHACRGKGDRRAAAAVFRRTLGLAVGAGVAIMCALLASRASLPTIFTPDAAVVQQVGLVSKGRCLTLVHSPRSLLRCPPRR